MTDTSQPVLDKSDRSAEWARDHELCLRICAGDDDAFCQLIDSLHRPLLRIAEAHVGRGPTAEDLVQETWARVIDHIKEFEGRSALRTWITRILMNLAITRRERDKRTVSLDAEGQDDLESCFSSLGFWGSAPAQGPGPEDELLQKEASARLAAALDALPEVQRAVVTLRDVEEWSSEEVCNALGVSESNQRVLLHRGRQRLRAVLTGKTKNESSP